MGSPSPLQALQAMMLKQRVVVDVGDMAVSNSGQVILSTYALGSCIGVVAYDPVSRVGGILHLMLPDSKVSPDKAAVQPAMFADTGLPRFFRTIQGMKGEPSRLRVFVAGGASVVNGLDSFKIGERNSKATLDYLYAARILIRRTEVGGSHNRTLHLDVSTGAVTMKTPVGDSAHDLAG